MEQPFYIYESSFKTEQSFYVYVTPRTDNKIQMIKIVRELTSRSLKEAKEFVEHCWYLKDSNGYSYTYNPRTVRLNVTPEQVIRALNNITLIQSVFTIKRELDTPETIYL